MYLAPLNYDRYFKKVFAEERIAKQFLEDFLDVTITSLEKLPVKHKVTDDAAIVEFDYRCQIDGSYVIIDMQQWYKPDLVQRFYLYHALNTGLQLEDLPKRRLILDYATGKFKKAKDYRLLEPVLTLVWMVDDTLQFTQNYIAYRMAPELVLDFVENDRLWRAPQIKALLEERAQVLEVSRNYTKALDFLGKNRLIFLFQKNIVKAMQNARYERWFSFAEKSRNLDNTAEDFEEFRGDDIFEEMIRRLNRDTLTDDDFDYITTEQEMWAEMLDVEQMFYQQGHRDGHWGGREEGRYEQAILMAQNMLADGLSPETIAKYTELPISDIIALQKT